MSIEARFRDLPIQRKVMLLMLLSSAIALALAAVALIGYAWLSTRANAEQDLVTVSRIVADNTAAAMVFNDPKAANETLAALRAKPDIQTACLYLHDAAAPLGPFAAYARDGTIRCPMAPPREGVLSELDTLKATVAVRLKGEPIGALEIGQDFSRLRQALVTQGEIMAAIVALSFAISVAFAVFMQRLISLPILRLAQTARQVSETGDYARRATASGRDEVGKLVEDFNQMLGWIGLRDLEISRARDALAEQVEEKTRSNTRLEQALRQLRDTQAQLVQSEKLASLGALVAGVAHEINTPVGVGVTAASTLQAAAARLKAGYQAGELKRSELERFVALADESARILMRNLQRAAELIQSFKQVAVDQSSGERRRFDLRGYIDEVLVSLGPRLKHTGHTVEVDCPEALSIDGYPGALAQILANLVSNSLLHAYQPGEAGTLSIRVRSTGGWVTLVYADDGHGIPPENLPRIFDPFFTTKRGSGGSGLGMHIVFNLVTQALGGTIQVASAPGQGAEFTLRFPVQPERPAA
ncbi:MAG TPA: ATP-binding protein [Solimonas sp.]|nr:ATP-binding protein [Solimonas sp.]